MALVTIGFIAYLVLLMSKDMTTNISPTSSTKKALESKLAKEGRSWKNLKFDLVDPGQAPPELRSTVEVGYRLMLHTHELLPDFVNAHMDCTNCHFGGGITSGGTNGGISLAGVAAQYPKVNPTTHAVEDLQTRINSCFTNSMNGKPLPLESKELLALVTYMHWISERYPIYGGAPWLGVRAIQSEHVPDKDNGQKLYVQLCGECHGQKGEGSNDSKEHPGLAVPPVWGDFSFNSSAGMNKLETFASFIYHNMPYDNPDLTPSEALDIAAFVTEQPRPKK